MSYSQHDEELHILNLFGDQPGRFLDIGANDGHYLSNSLALVERGWEGVLVEANPDTFCRLVARHGSNRKLTLVNAAIGLAAPQLTKFWQATADDGLSTTEQDQHDRRDGEARFRSPFYVCMISLRALLNTFPGPVDFVSIDTEGTSVGLFLAFPLNEIKPRALCVEHDGRIGECLAHADWYGYREITRNSENLLICR